MDYLYKNRRFIVVILASILIGLGLFQALTEVQLNRTVVSTIEYIAFFGALYLLIILPKSHLSKMNKDTDEKVENQIDQKEKEE